MINVRKHVETLPVIDMADSSVEFKVEKLPMVASCENEQSIYADLCNTVDLENNIWVMADGFLYKSKYCALCHGFESYTPLVLQLLNGATPVNISGIGMTIPDGSFNIKVWKDKLLGFEREELDISVFFPKKVRLHCSGEGLKWCLRSYSALIVISNRKYANPYCAKCFGETKLANREFLNQNIYLSFEC